MSDINALREHLFAAIDGLRKGTLKVAEAKAISELSQTVINSAKVELEFMQATESEGTGFIPAPKPALPNVSGQPRLVKGYAQSGSK